MTTLLITPLQKEFEIFLSTCRENGIGDKACSVGRLPVLHFQELALTVAQGGAGKVQFAVQTQHLLDHCPNLDLVICAGAAGALVDELAIGDMVAATSTVEHDYRNRFRKTPLPRFENSAVALQVLRALSPSSHRYQLFFGPVASGDEDIVDLERREALRRDTGALAVAWEGAGGARACAFCQVPYLELRAITDAAGPSAPADFENNLHLAMGNLAELVIHWLGSA
jgi:adenosylhomocysteine nucleosidase